MQAESEMVSDVVDEAIVEEEIEDDDKYTISEKYALLLSYLLFIPLPLVILFHSYYLQLHLLLSIRGLWATIDLG